VTPPAADGPAISRCHAVGCPKVIESFRLMCGDHWRSVPSELQTGVWAAYRHGQETDGKPSREYLEAAERAIAAVARADGQLKIPGF
jgi:hypothetical protein